MCSIIFYNDVLKNIDNIIFYTDLPAVKLWNWCNEFGELTDGDFLLLRRPQYSLFTSFTCLTISTKSGLVDFITGVVTSREKS